MPVDWALAIVSFVLIAVATVSKRVSGTPFTLAILFVSSGLLVGSQVLDGIDISRTSSTVRTLAEATLALVLFSDASRIDFGKLREDVSVPIRLLGIGLPVTIALGVVAAALIVDQLTIGEAVILAVLLAPTDAALGQAVVTELRVPARVRRASTSRAGSTTYPAPLGLSTLPSDPATLEAIDRTQREHASTVADRGGGFARSVGLVAVPQAVPDEVDVADTLIDIAREQDAAVVVVGSHGISGLRSSAARKRVAEADRAL